MATEQVEEPTQRMEPASAPDAGISSSEGAGSAPSGNGEPELLSSAAADGAPGMKASEKRDGAAKPSTDAEKAGTGKGAGARGILQTAKRSLTGEGMGKARLRTRRRRLDAALRFALQVAFFILAPGAFSAAMGGLRYLFAQVGAVQAFEVTSMVLALLGVCVLTCVFGRFFCGYACSFGLLNDMMYFIGAPLRKLLKVPQVNKAPRLSGALSLVKYAVLAAICILAYMGSWSLVSDYDPWSAFAAIIALNFDGIHAVGAVVLALCCVGMLFIERFFCRALCPLGAVFSFLPTLPFFTYGRNRERCAKRCDRCRDNCPMGIHPDKDGALAGECIECARCVSTCPVGNIGCVRGAEKSPKVKGNGPGWVLLKAAAVLVVLWAVGQTRYLPGDFFAFFS